jgi:hypothetical protein
MYRKTKGLELLRERSCNMVCFSLIAISSLSSWRDGSAIIFNEKSPMDIGVSSVLGGLGGLTREFWAVFAKIVLGGASLLVSRAMPRLSYLSARSAFIGSCAA